MDYLNAYIRLCGRIFGLLDIDLGLTRVNRHQNPPICDSIYGYAAFLSIRLYICKMQHAKKFFRHVFDYLIFSFY